MAITLIQTTSKNAGAVGSSTLAFGSNVTAGSLLVAYVYKNSSGNTPTASDNVNGNYSGGTQDVTRQFSSSSASICTFANAAGGATTVTFNSGGTGSLQCVIEEWSGITVASALDQIAQTTYSGSTTPSSGASPTTTQANELVLGMVGMDNGQTVTAGSGYTIGTNANAGRIGIENKIVSSTGAQTATFTLGASDTGVCMVATYKAASGPADNSALLPFIQSKLAGPFTPTQFSQFPYSTFIPPPPQPPGPGVVGYIPRPGPGKGPDIRTLFASPLRTYSTSPPSGSSAGGPGVYRRRKHRFITKH